MNCIGLRNYAFFVCLLVSVSFLGLSVFIGIGLWCIQDTMQTHIWWILIVLGAPVAFVFLAVLLLGGFHTYLGCKGYTTKEACTGKPPTQLMRELCQSRRVRQPTLVP